MEELQDAIEDAQYVNAISAQDDGPRPVLPWETPTCEQLQEWEEKHAHFDDFEWTVRSSAISFFLFSSFVKTSTDDYVRINFCEEVARYRKRRNKPRQLKAEQLMAQFLVAPPSRPPPPPPPLLPVRPDSSVPAAGESAVAENSASFTLSNPKEYLSTLNNESLTASISTQNSPSQLLQSHKSLSMPLTTQIPPRTEIDEFDLERTVPAWDITVEEINKKLQVNMDWPDCTETFVGIKGPILKEILRRLEDMRKAERRNRSEGNFDVKDSHRLHQQQVLNRPQSFSMNQSSEVSTRSAALSLTKELRKSISDIVHGSSNDNFNKNNHNLDASTRVLGQNYAEATSETISITDAPSIPQGVAISTSNLAKSNTDEHGLSQSLHEINNFRDLTRRLLDNNSLQKHHLDDSIFDDAERVVMESLRRDYWAAFQESPELRKLKHFLWYQHRPVVPDDFFVLRVLGRGGFGLVTACKKGASGKLYAMKVMSKRRIKMRRAEQLALNERQALAAVESKFVVNLKYSFHSKEDVYLILDLMTGGDLGYHLHQKGFFPKRECQYYAVRIMLGLQALHDKHYVYRDLKPENCLLADDGRMKISDLGLATKITPTLHGAAGTRGYWAPEMLRRDKKGRRMPYGHTVDWFSFGCCISEFISGTNPFRSEAALNFGLDRGMQTKERAIDLATREMDPVFSPEFFESDAADLCRRLLDKNELTRLGYSGCEEIMAHPWFKNVNWEAMISDKKRPPFVPPKDVNAASQSEIGMFAEDKAYQETVLVEADNDFYKTWDWTNPRAFAAEVIEFLIYERETGEPLIPMTQLSTCCCDIL